MSAYNGIGPEAQAYGQQVIADADAYQGTSTMISTGCAAAATAGRYANPLANAPHVIPERIDMGVDYADPRPEPIDAIGAGTITYAGPQGGGWQPKCINHTLVQPPTPTEQYIYICENIAPTVHAGQVMQPSQQIAALIAGGAIETGFAAAPRSPISTPRAALGQEPRAATPATTAPTPRDDERSDPASWRARRPHRRPAVVGTQC